MLIKLDHFPNFRGENFTKIFELPPSRTATDVDVPKNVTTWRVEKFPQILRKKLGWKVTFQW